MEELQQSTQSPDLVEIIRRMYPVVEWEYLMYDSFDRHSPLPAASQASVTSRADKLYKLLFDAKQFMPDGYEFRVDIE